MYGVANKCMAWQASALQTNVCKQVHGKVCIPAHLRATCFSMLQHRAHALPSTWLLTLLSEVTVLRTPQPPEVGSKSSQVQPRALPISTSCQVPNRQQYKRSNEHQPRAPAPRQSANFANKANNANRAHRAHRAHRRGPAFPTAVPVCSLLQSPAPLRTQKTPNCRLCGRQTADRARVLPQEWGAHAVSRRGHVGARAGGQRSRDTPLGHAPVIRSGTRPRDTLPTSSGRLTGRSAGGARVLGQG